MSLPWLQVIILYPCSHGYTGDDFSGSNVATGAVKLEQLDEVGIYIPLCCLVT